MQKVAMILVCLACSSDARRLQQQSQDDSLEELASLLLAPSPTFDSTRKLAARTRTSSPLLFGPQGPPVRPKDKKVFANIVAKADVMPGTVSSGIAFGQEVAVVRTADGKAYGLQGKFPPADSPISGAKVVGDTVIDGITGTAFNVKTGKVEGPWCPGGILGWLLKLAPPRDLKTYKLKESGPVIQAEINANVQGQMEFDNKYWRGILDAQGKTDGGYY